MQQEIDEGVEAGVAHGQPVEDEPDDVDVLEAEKRTLRCVCPSFVLRFLTHLLISWKKPARTE